MNSLIVHSFIVIKQQCNNQPNITIYCKVHFCAHKNQRFFFEPTLQKEHGERCVDVGSFRPQWRSSFKLEHKIYHTVHFYWPRNKGIAIICYREGLPSPLFLSCQWEKWESYSDAKQRIFWGRLVLFFSPSQLNLFFVAPDFLIF